MKTSSDADAIDAQWLLSCQEALLQASRLVPLSSRAMHGSGGSSKPTPQEGVLKESLVTRDDNLGVVMKLEERLSHVDQKAAKLQAETSAQAAEIAHLAEGFLPEERLRQLTEAHQNLRRAQSLERVLDRMLTEAALKYGVDWSADPELAEHIVGQESRRM